jgi:hypothetical protein
VSHQHLGLFSHLHALKIQQYPETVDATEETPHIKPASGPLFHNFFLTTRPESSTEASKARLSQFSAKLHCAAVEDVNNNNSLVRAFRSQQGLSHKDLGQLRTALCDDYDRLYHAGKTGDRSEPAGQCVPWAPTLEPTCDGKLREAPTMELAALALADLKKMLQGNSRGKGGGYKDPGINPFVQHKLDATVGKKTVPMFGYFGKIDLPKNKQIT